MRADLGFGKYRFQRLSRFKLYDSIVESRCAKLVAQNELFLTDYTKAAGGNYIL